MMDRRTLISAIALATVCARSGAFAQQQRSWRVGFVALPERPEPLEGSRFGAFALGMRELGYIERRNLTIEWRFAGGEVGRLAELTALPSRLGKCAVSHAVDAAVAARGPLIASAVSPSALAAPACVAIRARCTAAAASGRPCRLQPAAAADRTPQMTSAAVPFRTARLR